MKVLEIIYLWKKKLKRRKMISNKTLTQEDIDKIIKEGEEQIVNEPVYEKNTEENEEWLYLGYNRLAKTIEQIKVLKNV